MITTTGVGQYTLRGISLGGVYTSIHVPELGVLFDVGLPLRTAISADTLLLSHGHPDHVGGLGSFLSMRMLRQRAIPLRIIMPVEIVENVRDLVDAQSKFLRYPLEVDLVGVVPGVLPFKNNLTIRVFRTHHVVPSIGFAIGRTVDKLKPELVGLPGTEIRRLREAGEVTTVPVTTYDLAFATDTRIEVLDAEPWLYDVKALILECTFLDDQRSVEDTRHHGHLHLDEVIERAALFKNKDLVLIHPSQMYSPVEVREILHRRLPGLLEPRVNPFVGASTEWPD